MHFSLRGWTTKWVYHRLLAVEKLRIKIAEEARLKKEEADKKFYGNQHSEVCRPIGHDTKNDEKLVTRKELSKISGVDSPYFLWLSGNTTA